MATLNIYLGNPHKLALSWWEVEDLTWLLFKQSVERSAKDKFDAVRVKMVTTVPALLPEDLLIYVVRHPEQGVIGSRFGGFTAGENQYGQTLWEGNLYGAEVYVRDKMADPWWVAKFIWHEALHVKSKEDHAMHKRGGLAGAPIEEHTELTPANIEFMRKRLSKQRPMWAGGLPN